MRVGVRFKLYVITDIPNNSECIYIQKLLHVLSESPAKLQSKRYKVKKTAVLVAPNQDFYIEYSSPIDPPDCPLESGKFTPPEKESQPQELEIWETILKPPKAESHHPTRPPDTTTLTGHQFMQHFPSSPPSRRISLSSEGPLSLQWDEQDSFQSYSEAVFPSPPEAACSSQSVQPLPDLSLDQHSSLADSSSSLSNEVFTDDIAPSPFLPLRAPKKKKPNRAAPAELPAELQIELPS